MPGHTKFEHDVIFAFISKKFKITNVFNGTKLHEFINSLCPAKAIDLSDESYRLWRRQLDKKYKTIKNIAMYNHTNTRTFCEDENRRVAVKVKRSVTETEYEKAFHTTVNGEKVPTDAWDLIQEGIYPSLDIVPGVDLSVKHNSSMRIPLSKKKFGSIHEIFACHITPDRFDCAVEEDAPNSGVQGSLNRDNEHRFASIKLNAWPLSLGAQPSRESIHFVVPNSVHDRLHC